MDAPNDEYASDFYDLARGHLKTAEGYIGGKISPEHSLALANAYASLAVFKQLQELDVWLEVLRDKLESINYKLGQSGAVAELLRDVSNGVKHVENAVTNID